MSISTNLAKLFYYSPIFMFSGMGSTLPAPAEEIKLKTKQKYKVDLNQTVEQGNHLELTLLSKTLSSFVAHLLQKSKSLVFIAEGVLKY